MLTCSPSLIRLPCPSTRKFVLAFVPQVRLSLQSFEYRRPAPVIGRPRKWLAAKQIHFLQKAFLIALFLADCEQPACPYIQIVHGSVRRSVSNYLRPVLQLV